MTKPGMALLGTVIDGMSRRQFRMWHWGWLPTGDEPIFVTMKPEAAHKVSALAALVDAGLVVMRHDPDWCGCSGTTALTMRCVDLTTGAT
jgi:hypothetical protein